MEAPINPFFRRIATSSAHSLLVYQSDMWFRHNLKVSLHRNSLRSFSRRSLMKLLAIRLSSQANKSLVMRGSLRFIP